MRCKAYRAKSVLNEYAAFFQNASQNIYSPISRIAVPRTIFRTFDRIIYLLPDLSFCTKPTEVPAIRVRVL